MCIICSGEYEGLDILDCSGCIKLKEIPVIPGLKVLNCSRCPNLVKISIIPKLNRLNCSRCMKLKDVPVIPNIWLLDCSYCPSITEIPLIPGLKYIFVIGCKSLTKIPIIYGIMMSHGCHWLDYDNNDFKKNVEKLIKIQRYIKKYHKLRILKKWINSENFNDWYYNPEGIGGIKTVLRLKKRFADLHMQ